MSASPEARSMVCAGVELGPTTPNQATLIRFENEVEHVGIRGMRLDYSKKRGPSSFRQTAYKMERLIHRAENRKNSKLQNKWRMALEKHLSTPFDFDFSQGLVRYFVIRLRVRADL
jgi:hypothetical protein